jgi:AcrR family transcriptional regulator
MKAVATVAHARRVREIARTREDILLAAARTFARAGYHATRMQEVAADAGYSVPSLYAYFRSKQDIFDAVIDRLRTELLGTFDESTPAGLSFRARLEWLVRRQLEVNDRWSDALAVLFLAGAPPAARGRQGRSGLAAYAPRFAEWIREAAGKALGEQTSDDLGFVLAGMVIGFTRHWIETGRRGRLADRTQRVVDLFLHGALGPGEAGR